MFYSSFLDKFQEEEIQKHRKILGKAGESLSDEEIMELIWLVKTMRNQIDRNMDDMKKEAESRTRRKLLKKGYSEEDLEKYLRIKTKTKYGFEFRPTKEDIRILSLLDGIYTEILNELLHKIHKEQMKEMSG